jgi:GT2 family glycosyltransferase
MESMGGRTEKGGRQAAARLLSGEPRWATGPALEQGILAAPAADAQERPKVRGKFLYVGEEKLWVRGVTYGTFRPNEKGEEFHHPEAVDRDFALMAASGINAVRTYTVPPRWLLDLARRHRLRVMVGLPWEQHVAFLSEKGRARSIEERVREGVRACAGHPAVLCYAVGNEIPAPIVRWHGRGPVEAFIERLCRAAKSEDPGGLVTYVNYPSTEYLQLPFVDFVCFNVYLESKDRLDAYLARLQNIAGNRPLVMAEIGLDSRRNGEEAQARALDWQVRAAFGAGCAGAFVFAWTDAWYRGGFDIEDWDFGITTRDRRPKPALAAVTRAFAEIPFPGDLPWPFISVVVCSYNGSRTIRDTLEGLSRLQYPTYEVIVVNDGSTDPTPSIAGQYGVRLITVQNGGLSKARNIGLEAARGEIVAYIDDDAYPDPHWLTYLAAAFVNSDHVGVGGPNIAPEGDGPIAECIANAPGGPIHVLVSDSEAEHIPGCNMAFRKEPLKAIGGFDPRFRVAGDDVDVCWRLQERGWTLGFSPAAMVWHHRRDSVRTYWRQQKNYGKAEALLEMKWPEKYNVVGHLSWKGRLYGSGLTHALPPRRWHVYHGVWGSGLFQSLYAPAPDLLRWLPMMPEWFLVVFILAGLCALGFFWPPLVLASPLLAVAGLAPVAQALFSASHARFSDASRRLLGGRRLVCLTALLHLMQPAARLWGRLHNGLTPWRRRGAPHLALPWPRTEAIWSERWQAPERRLASVEAILRSQGVVVARGGDYDRWDLEIRGGLLGVVRTRMALEEHGAGKQQVLFRSWPRFSAPGSVLTLLCAALSIAAAMDSAWAASVPLGAAAFLLAARALGDCAAATASFRYALRQPGIGWRRQPSRPRAGETGKR